MQQEHICAEHKQITNIQEYAIQEHASWYVTMP